MPANRFEVLECRAAIDAAEAGDQDAVHTAPARSTCWRSTSSGTACAGPFEPDALYREVALGLALRRPRRARSSTASSISSPTGGYALRPTSAMRACRPTGDGTLRLSHPRLAQQYRMNAGTIVEAPMIKIRLVGRGAAQAQGPARRGR